MCTGSNLPGLCGTVYTSLLHLVIARGRMLDLSASSFTSMLSCLCIGIDISMFCFILCLAYGMGL